MKRRDFLRVSATGAAALLLPLTACEVPANAPVDEDTGEALPPRLVTTRELDRVSYQSDGTRLVVRPAEHSVTLERADGTVLVRFGRPGTGTDELNNPQVALVGGDDVVYVLDAGNHRVQRFARNGAHLGALGTDGPDELRLHHPAGLALDGKGRVLVSDTLNHRVQVFLPSGERDGVIGEFGETGPGLNAPTSLAVTTDGELHVLDAGNGRVQVFAEDGTHLRSYGHDVAGGRPMLRPSSLVLEHGRAHVADTTGRAVHTFRAATGELLGRESVADGTRLPVFLSLTPAHELVVVTA